MAYFERFVSRRYLFSRASRALVSVITFISIAGVTVGVAALIIVIGVIEGIDKDIFGKIVQIYPHLKISEAESKSLSQPDDLLAALKDFDEIEIAEPIFSKQVLFTFGSGESEIRVPGQIVGHEEFGEGRLYNIPNAVTGENLRLGSNEVMLGAPLAYHLHARQGDKVYVTTGMLARTAVGWRPRIRELTVVGIYQTGVWEFDLVTGFVSPATAREVFGLDKAADYMHIKLKDPFAVRAARDKIQAVIGEKFAIGTWEEENGEFFQALKMEKLGLTIILLLVVIVASFNIIGTLILLVIEKKSEIGILKAMGASDGMIHRTFLSAGLTIGTLGTFAGVTLGLLGAYILKNYDILQLPESAYNFSKLPVLVKPGSVLLITSCSMGIALLAAFFPAAQAARLDPVEALRHD